MKVLVIGGGNMGYTYAEAISKSKFVSRHKVMICDTQPDKVAELEELQIFDVYTNVTQCISKADIVFLAVKPNHAQDVFIKIKEHVHNDQLFISLMAGVKITTIQNSLGVHKVVRTMPNLPAKVGKGVTAYIASTSVSRIELIMVRNLLDTTGDSIKVDTEKQIDAATGISGSGPAYVFYFMQSMLEAALQMGFSEHDAKVLVNGTFSGAVELFQKGDASLITWMERVTSKGGTTQAALTSMETNQVKERIKEAAFAAFNRAVELGLNENK
jgi:pyrroline-5-carboxylate reductase